MEEKSSNNNPLYIANLVRGFQKSRILLTAIELDIFSHIDKKPLSSKDVATAIKTDCRATDRLMNALVAMNLLEKNGKLFSNTELSGKFLVKGKPAYMSNLHHSNHLWHTWSDLTEVVKGGKPVYKKAVKDKSDNWQKSFIEAMHNRGIVQAPMVAARIDLSNVDKMLDIGGGSGVFSMAFVKKKPTLMADVFDLPEIVGLTKKYIEREKMQSNVKTIAGDLHTDEFPEKYDLVFVSAIIHMLSEEDNIRLFEKCSKALNKGGILLLSDFIMNDNRTSPERGTIFAINMLVGTPEGDTYTFNEINAWLEKTGFTKLSIIDVPFEADLIMATKK